MSALDRLPMASAELHRLLPRGPLWQWRDGAVARALFDALAWPIAVAYDLLDRLPREADPRTTVECLTDWERVYGLPDQCGATATSLVARRAAVLERVNAPVGQRVEDLESVVKSFGLDCVVEQYQLSLVNEAEIGDYVTNEPWVHTLTIHLPDPPVVFFEADWSGPDDPLSEYVGDAIACAMDRVAPAHAQLVYVHDLPNNGYQPWDPFEPVPIPADARASAPTIELQEF